MSPRLFAQIQKIDEAKRLVLARAVQETVDKVDEIFDYGSSRPHFEAWSKEQFDASGGKSYGNVRAMHGKIAAGIVAAPLSFNDTEKAIDVAIKVTDDQEWAKCLDGTYTGISIGGSYVGERRTEKLDDGKEVRRYTARPAEISLVDSPCIPTARFFDVVKVDGVLEKRAFKPPQFEVTGTDDEVAQFAKLMQDKKLAMADVLGFLQKFTGKDKEDKQDEGDGDEPEDVDNPKEEHDEAISDHAHGKTAAAMESNKADAHAEAAHAHRAAEAHFDGKDQAASDHHGAMAAYHEQMASHKFVEAVGILKHLGKREFSQEQRDKDADKGKALPDGSFPIENVSDLKNAVSAYGRAKDKAKAKAHIVARAKALGATAELPEDWGSKEAVANALFDAASPSSLAKPLIESDSDEAFSSNVATSVKEGKPQDQAVAIAYSVKRKAQQKKAKEAGVDLPDFDSWYDTVASGMLLAKAAKLPAAHMDRVQAIHDHAANMGADCSAGKASQGDDLAKVAGLEKTVGELTAELKKLKDQPAPHPVTVLLTTKAVSRTDPPTKPADPNDLTIDQIPDAERVKNADGSIDHAASLLLAKTRALARS